MVLVTNFDSTDAVKGMFESDDYAKLVPARTRASRR
jgi:uncharacterized protein (DUF1330 family)